MLKKILIFILICYLFPVYAKDYQSTHDFLKQVFSNQLPKPKLLKLNQQLKNTAEQILQHKIGFMRTRYWQAGKQTVWIINEIGKTKPITTAVVIKENKITLIKVLAFRESRGWEVKHDFFTDQFKQITLNKDFTLSKQIDGISGATLSVKALSKVAQLALLFNQQIQHGD